MTTLMVIVALVAVVVAVGYAVLEKRPGYGVYFGLGKLTGSRLDIGPVVWAALTRHATPNDALVCPASHCPHARPDREPPVYRVEPAALLARLRDVAHAEADTVELSCEPNCDRAARFVQYTRLMRFPDTIDVEVLPVAAGQATLAIYSRSLVGRKDFGVNRARVERWLGMLD